MRHEALPRLNARHIQSVRKVLPTSSWHIVNNLPGQRHPAKGGNTGAQLRGGRGGRAWADVVRCGILLPVASKGTMDLDASRVFRACIRRWYVALPILAFAVWYAYSFYASVRPVYYANAVVGLAGSNEQTQFNPDGRPIARNGLLDIGGADLIMNLVVLGFDDPEVKSQVVAGGGKGNFTVRMFPPPPSAPVQTSLPLVMIEATEADPESATKTVELAASQTGSILARLQQQAGVPDSQMVRALQASSTKAVQGIPSRNKSLALILMVGIGLAIFGAVGVEISIDAARRVRNRDS